MSHGTAPSLIAAALAFLPACALRAASPDDFYTQRGDDPTWEEVMESGKLPRGENSNGGFKGSTVSVDHSLLASSPDAGRKIPEDIFIHTVGNSLIKRGEFRDWTRWYQEDGNTQVFRLFKGEENVRNERKLAGRIEAFSSLKWDKGDRFHEWTGTFTIIKPHRAAIFQVMNSEIEWAMHVSMDENGDVSYKHRVGGGSKVIARDMAGKPFNLRVRDNGHDFELFLDGKSQGAGTYARPDGVTNFRWGIYLESRECLNDTMLLVTGAGINVKGSDKAKAADTPDAEEPEAVPKQPDHYEGEPGIRIPARAWTNAGGKVIKASALYEPENGRLRLRVTQKWIAYPLENLSGKDRAFLLTLDRKR